MSRIDILDRNAHSSQNSEQTTAIVDFNYDNRQMDEEFFLNQGIELSAHLLQAVSKRRIDYLAGRLCARQALSKLGLNEQGSIAAGSNRIPQWPEGYLGAITHTKGYAAAIVGLRSHWLGLGIDAEVIVGESKPSLIRHVCRSGEYERLLQGSTKNDDFLFTLIFSAKESLFKALYPVVQNYFGFQAAQLIDLDLNTGNFVIQLAQEIHENLPVDIAFHGRFIQIQDKVVTLIKIPHSSSTSDLAASQLVNKK